MALRRKKRSNKPCGCYICKETKAFHTLHGGAICHYEGLSGKYCCDDCYSEIKKRNDTIEEREYREEETEAEYQISRKFGV